MFEARCAEVHKMLHDGKPLSSIEDWIYGLSGAEDYKDALWLLAWSEHPLATKPSRFASPRAARGRVAVLVGTQ